MKLISTLFFLTTALFCTASAASTTFFQDNFNAENGALGMTNYNGFANWTVSNGSVDLIGNGFFDLYPGNGLYLDLDGSTANAGTLTSTPIALPLSHYSLSFALGINGGFGNDSMTVSLGPYSEVFDVSDAGVPTTYNVIDRTILIPSAGNYSIVFDHDGGDDFGLVIDNVRLEILPEPSSLALLTLAVMAVRVRRR